MASEEMTATEVAALLDLKPHPEGGFYTETFRDGSITLTTSQLPPHCKSVWFIFLEKRLPCLIQLNKTIFSKGGAIRKEAGSGSGDLSDRESTLAGLLSSSSVGDVSHLHDERDQACWTGWRCNKDEQGGGVKKGSGLDNNTHREGDNDGQRREQGIGAN
ncbi:F14D16.29 [Zea mays]|uniref:F14D16.29 n=1 Tax=Zea mays TaxID=4577 RepID=A0A1D6KND5_MAIZE|nr:F14D16.29 [Zea mays]